MHPGRSKASFQHCWRVKNDRVHQGGWWSNEGPSHLEVQFWWTLRHIEAPTLATLITTRNSGSSYLNRVELQNGCLACAHANLFIPSNLNGSCFSPDTGKVDMNLLKSNMDSVTDIYISRVNQAPCGDSVIHLFKGADSSWNQKIQDYLSIFLKGTKKRKAELMIILKSTNMSTMSAQYMHSTWSKTSLPSMFTI